MADGVAIIKIGGSVEDVATAAEQFLSQTYRSLAAGSSGSSGIPIY